MHAGHAGGLAAIGIVLFDGGVRRMSEPENIEPRPESRQRQIASRVTPPRNGRSICGSGCQGARNNREPQGVRWWGVTRVRKQRPWVFQEVHFFGRRICSTCTRCRFRARAATRRACTGAPRVPSRPQTGCDRGSLRGARAFVRAADDSSIGMTTRAAIILRIMAQTFCRPRQQRPASRTPWNTLTRHNPAAAERPS